MGPFPASVAYPAFGPRSSQPQSVPISLTMITPNWAQSGQDVTASVNKPLGMLQIHVKGSSPAGNSDVDATFAFWNVIHVRQGVSNTWVRLGSSDLVLVPSSITSLAQLHITASVSSPANSRYSLIGGLDPLDPVNHWLHLTQTATFHAFASGIVALFQNTATLGVEHVPEPATGALLGCGLLALAGGRYARIRRLRAA